MRIRDTVRRAGQSLRHAKARTLLTSLAIGVGAFTITLALAAGEGGREYTEDIVTSNTNVQEIMVSPQQDMADPNQPQEYSAEPSMSFGGGFSTSLLDEADIEELSEIDGVQSASPQYTVDIKYVTRADEKKYTASVQSFSPSIQQEYVAGNGDDLQPDEVIIPYNFSEALGFASEQAALGQTIQIVADRGGSSPAQPETGTFEYTVAGVTGEPSAITVAAGNAFQLHADAALEVYDYTQQNTPMEGTYFGAIALAGDDVDVDVLKERIEEAGYVAQTSEDLLSFMFQFINVLQAILIGFGALAVLTSVFGIINTQYISVLERTQQIGLMKALGMRRRDVGRLFRYEAAWVGFLGGAIGAGLAIAAGVIANPWISESLSLGGVHLLVFDPLSVGAVVLGLMLVSVVSGMLPARKAAKLDPIEALRTE